MRCANETIDEHNSSLITRRKQNVIMHHVETCNEKRVERKCECDRNIVDEIAIDERSKIEKTNSTQIAKNVQLLHFASTCRVNVIVRCATCDQFRSHVAFCFLFTFKRNKSK